MILLCATRHVLTAGELRCKLSAGYNFTLLLPVPSGLGTSILGFHIGKVSFFIANHSSISQENDGVEKVR